MKNKNEKILIILLSVVVIAALAVIAVLVAGNREAQKEEKAPASGYEANVILDDPQTLQDFVDEMVKKAAEGQMTLEMEVTASGTDGQNFNCYLANAKENSYDMYLILYLDETQEEIYRSGLIPVGGRIETFRTSVKLEPGKHVCTLVFNQVEADGETLHAQVNVGLDLVVGE